MSRLSRLAAVTPALQDHAWDLWLASRRSLAENGPSNSGSHNYEDYLQAKAIACGFPYERHDGDYNGGTSFKIQGLNEGQRLKICREIGHFYAPDDFEQWSIVDHEPTPCSRCGDKKESPF